jgi:hypothetical protein
MSLFEEYPPLPRKAPKLQRDDCCDAWASFIEGGGDVRDLACNFLHRRGHRTMPFSVETLAEVAEIDITSAEGAIEWAVELGWIAPIQPEYYQRVADRLWTGRLPKER